MWDNIFFAHHFSTVQVEIFFKEWPGARNHYGTTDLRNHGTTELFYKLRRAESPMDSLAQGNHPGDIYVLFGLRPVRTKVRTWVGWKRNLQLKSLQECARVPRFWEGLSYGSPYRLEILTKIFRKIFKKNLCLWLILSRLGKVKPNFPFALAAPEFLWFTFG